MKCPYAEIECDYPVSTGDIECSECIHYLEKDKSTSILDWIKGLLKK